MHYHSWRVNFDNGAKGYPGSVVAAVVAAAAVVVVVVILLSPSVY